MAVVVLALPNAQTQTQPEGIKVGLDRRVITDAMGKVQGVRGPGVVGNQTVLAPGESFEYTSGCLLTVPFGSMHGTYQMVNHSKEQFDTRSRPSFWPSQIPQ